MQIQEARQDCDDAEMPPEAKLSKLHVGDIHPNRVCCNALMAALSRAKPPQWHLVTISC